MHTYILMALIYTSGFTNKSKAVTSFSVEFNNSVRCEKALQAAKTAGIIESGICVEK